MNINECAVYGNMFHKYKEIAGRDFCVPFAPTAVTHEMECWRNTTVFLFEAEEFGMHPTNYRSPALS